MRCDVRLTRLPPQCGWRRHLLKPRLLPSCHRPPAIAIHLHYSPVLALVSSLWVRSQQHACNVTTCRVRNLPPGAAMHAESGGDWGRRRPRTVRAVSAVQRLAPSSSGHGVGRSAGCTGDGAASEQRSLLRFMQGLLNPTSLRLTVAIGSGLPPALDHRTLAQAREQACCREIGRSAVVCVLRATC